MKGIFWLAPRLQIGITVLVMACAAPLSAAPVYQCGQGSELRYSNVPCFPGQPPMMTTLPNGSAPPDAGEAAIARQFDADVNRQRAARDHADAAWVADQKAKQLEVERLRRAEMEGRVVKGMTTDQVERILNEPTRITRQNGKERWFYVNGRLKQTVTFKEGLVVGDAQGYSRHY